MWDILYNYQTCHYFKFADYLVLSFSQWHRCFNNTYMHACIYTELHRFNIAWREQNLWLIFIMSGSFPSSFWLWLLLDQGVLISFKNWWISTQLSLKYFMCLILFLIWQRQTLQYRFICIIYTFIFFTFLS